MDPSRLSLHQSGIDNNTALAGCNPLYMSGFRERSLYGATGYIEPFLQGEAALQRLYSRDLLLERDLFPVQYPTIDLVPPARRWTFEEEIAIIREVHRLEQEKQLTLLESECEVSRLKSENLGRHHKKVRESSVDEDDYRHGSAKKRHRESRSPEYYSSRRQNIDFDRDRGRKGKIRLSRRARSQMRSNSREREQRLVRDISHSLSSEDGGQRSRSPRRDRSRIKSKSREVYRSSHKDKRHERSYSLSSDNRRSRSYSPHDSKRVEETCGTEKKSVGEATRSHQGPTVPPSATLAAKGLSKETLEVDLYRALSDWGPLTEVRIIREKLSGISRGFAFIDFPSVEGAQKVVEGLGRDGLVVNGRRVFFHYSSKPNGGTIASQTQLEKSSLESKSAVAAATDWRCKCGCVNFARRTVCYKCNESQIEVRGTEDMTLSVASSSASKNSEPDPTNVLVVRGLDENVDEEILRFEFCKYAPVKDLRLVRNKLTNVSRGFAFVHFLSVDEASKALEATNGTTMGKNGPVMKVSYAKSNGTPINGNSLATAAIEAAAFSKQYDSIGWAPKEYCSEDGYAGKNGNKDSNGSSGKTSLLDSNMGNIGSVEKNTAVHSGFIWDEKSGYYYDPALGLYYDGNQGLYYDSNKGLWYTYNQETKAYVQLSEPSIDSKVNNKVANDISKLETSTKCPASEKVIHSKAVLSAPACTLLVKKDTGKKDVDKKSKLAERVTEAIKKAQEAAKKQKEKIKEKQKELAGKNPGMGSQKLVDVAMLWKRKNEASSLSCSAGGTCSAPLTSAYLQPKGMFAKGSDVSTSTFSKSDDASPSVKEATSHGTNVSVHTSGNISGAVAVTRIKAVIRESGKEKDVEVVLVPPVGTTEPPESSGRIIDSTSKTIPGVLRESGKGTKSSAHTETVLGSSISQLTASTLLSSTGRSKASEASGRMTDPPGNKMITGVIREPGKFMVKKIDVEETVGLPLSSSAPLSSNASNMAEISGRMSDLELLKKITRTKKESAVTARKNIESETISVLTSASLLSSSITLKANASAAESHASLAGHKRRFSEVPGPVVRDIGAENASSCGYLQSVPPRSVADSRFKGAEDTDSCGMGSPYPRKFDGKPVQKSALRDQGSFDAVRGQQVPEACNVDNQVFQSIGWQEVGPNRVIDSLELPKSANAKERTVFKSKRSACDLKAAEGTDNHHMELSYPRSLDGKPGQMAAFHDQGFLEAVRGQQVPDASNAGNQVLRSIGWQGLRPHKEIGTMDTSRSMNVEDRAGVRREDSTCALEGAEDSDSDGLESSYHQSFDVSVIPDLGSSESLRSLQVPCASNVGSQVFRGISWKEVDLHNGIYPLEPSKFMNGEERANFRMEHSTHTLEGAEDRDKHDLGLPYPRSFDGKSVRMTSFHDLGSFETIRGQQFSDASDVGNQVFQGSRWQRPDLHKGLDIAEPSKLMNAGKRANFSREYFTRFFEDAEGRDDRPLGLLHPRSSDENSMRLSALYNLGSFEAVRGQEAADAIDMGKQVFQGISWQGLGSQKGVSSIQPSRFTYAEERAGFRREHSTCSLEGSELGANPFLGLPYPQRSDEKSVLMSALGIPGSLEATGSQETLDARKLGDQVLQGNGWQGLEIYKGVGTRDASKFMDTEDRAGFSSQWAHKGISLPLQARESTGFTSQWGYSGELSQTLPSRENAGFDCQWEEPLHSLPSQERTGLASKWGHIEEPLRPHRAHERTDSGQQREHILESLYPPGAQNRVGFGNQWEHPGALRF